MVKFLSSSVEPSWPSWKAARHPPGKLLESEHCHWLAIFLTYPPPPKQGGSCMANFSTNNCLLEVCLTSAAVEETKTKTIWKIFGKFLPQQSLAWGVPHLCCCAVSPPTPTSSEHHSQTNIRQTCQRTIFSCFYWIFNSSQDPKAGKLIVAAFKSFISLYSITEESQFGVMS